MSRESTSSRAEDAAQQMLVYGIPRTVSDLIGQLDAVDSDAIQREAQRMLESPVTLSAVGPLADQDSLRDINQWLQ